MAKELILLVGEHQGPEQGLAEIWLGGPGGSVTA